jgi:hypothetical protein
VTPDGAAAGGVTFVVLAVHLAVYVTLLLTIVFVVICVPPEAAVNQPAKVCPDLVGVGNVPTVEPAVTVLDGTELPPLELKVMVTFVALAVHLAV